ncbi:MAG: nicotinamide-nucleotide amidohydrolase family protein, partial [Thermoanaerobaculia bacterium]|nr:nicotinamide-nucleotide amidohydrolase family protein [Thermoanaerobaculia bacterium]
EIRVELSARGAEPERKEELDRMAERARALIGPAVFTDDAGRSLAQVVGELLREQGRTLATAESCTGGMVAARITDVPGSSDYFLGALVVYSNRAKRELAGVDRELLEEQGAVSEPVSRALARGAREALGADYGIGITGIAGPGGGSEEKPVGLVHLGLAGPDGGETQVRVQFPGDRERVRRYTTRMALEMLRRALLELPVGNPRDPRE